MMTNNEKNNHTCPGRGDLLIARPYLGESVFSNSVILILDSGLSQGVMGISLNVPTNISMADLMPSWEKGQEIEVFCGGPVGTDRMFILHTLGERVRNSLEIVPGLWLGGEIEDIVEYIEDGNPVQGHIRFFVGYSGWQTEQLEEELEENTWAVSRATNPQALLTGCAITFWRCELARLSPRYHSWLLLPTKPELN